MSGEGLGRSGEDCFEASPTAVFSAPLVRRLGIVDYEPNYVEMRRFTGSRDAHTPDEIWVLQHFPV